MPLERMLRIYFMQQWYGLSDPVTEDAPSSTKNRDNARDTEMKQTKKGNQWYFGMKAHVGTDSSTGLAHSVVVTKLLWR